MDSIKKELDIQQFFSNKKVILASLLTMTWLRINVVTHSDARREK